MRNHAPGRALRAAVILIGLAACAPDSTSPTVTSSLRLTANVSGTPISTVVVTVTAEDIREPLVFNVTAENGTASASIDVPPGHSRTFVAQGFDVTGVITHDGTATMNVAKGSNPPVALTMRPRSGQVTVTVTVGSIGVTLDWTSVEIEVGNPFPLTASVVKENGTPVEGAVVSWASTNPAVATVSPTGVVTPLIVGTTQIVAVYGGVAASCVVTVAPGSRPLSNDVILFMRTSPTGGIFQINANDLVTQQIGEIGDQTPAISPDRRRIAFHRFNGDPLDKGIWIMNADGTNRVHLTNDANDQYPSWSPDGRRIAFQKSGTIWVMDANGKNATALFSGTDWLSAPAWSPDGTRLAYGSASGEVVIVSLNGVAKAEKFIGSHPAWSPDGTRMLFRSNGIQIRDLTTMTNTVLTTDASDTQPAWSPDGTRVAFMRGGYDKFVASIWVMKADGTTLPYLTSFMNDSHPNWK